MNAHLPGRWTDLRLLVPGTGLVSAFLAAALYAFCFRPLAADAAAVRLQELATLTQEGLATLATEQQAALIADLQRRLDYVVLDDALAAPGLAAPGSGWLGLVADRLQRKSDGHVGLRVMTDVTRVWINLETDERRYWLGVPAASLGAARPLWLAAGIGAAFWMVLLATLLELRRRSLNVARFGAALRHVGTGDVAKLLSETGSAEEQDFSRAFNDMVRGLQRLDAESRLLLGGISHDLRTPLTSMRLGLELAKDNMEAGLAASLYQDAEDLESILSQFLDYARDDTLEAVEERDINELILEIVLHVNERGHQVELDLGPVPMFPFRKLAMRRLITNLLVNAVNYARVGVEVRCHMVAGGMLEISVLDRGPGLDESQLDQMLRPFVRGAEPGSGHPGAGLGLTIASRITRIHGGILHLTNRPEGGLEARIEIPTQNERS
jgi:two-component system osmolarity sensor histidine kinase EnvZ